MAADEASFLDLLVASERCGEWLDVLRVEKNAHRLLQILHELSDAVQSSDAYAEEAREEGAIQVLTQLFKRTDDDAVLDLASDIMAFLSGPMAASRKLSTFTYEGIQLVIQEGALGDGVGSKVWTVAHVLCRELAAHPSAVAGASVLELGAGTGICGMLAAKLGASRVVLSDYTDGVLRNLRDCMHLNAVSSGGGGSEQAAEGDRQAEQQQQQQLAGSGASSVAGTEAGAAWDAGCMQVRYLDWTDSLAAVGEAAPSLGRTIAAASHTSLDSLDRASNESRAPGVGPDERFELVVGTDVLYEWPMVDTLAAAIAHRLAPAGRCLLVCAVREAAMFLAFKQSTAQLGLRMGVTRIEPLPEDLASLGVQTAYEGGYVMMALEHEGQPSAAWHRDDLFASPDFPFVAASAP